jgi:hypothetical protein
VKRLTAFNQYLGEKVTAAVGTMWCAYVFTGLALISLPDAVHTGTAAIISWIAQTFLQLVLLSVIMVGQKSGNDWMVDELRDTHDVSLKQFDNIVKMLESLSTALGVPLPDKGEEDP